MAQQSPVLPRRDPDRATTLVGSTVERQPGPHRAAWPTEVPSPSVAHPAGSGLHRATLDTPRPDQLLAAARELAGTALGWPGIVEPSERRWALIAASDIFEAFVIAWPPGGFIELHDHGGASGAIVVAAGTLTEMSVRLAEDGRSSAATRTLGPGSHVVFGAGRVHDVVNRGPLPAVSVHVYSPRLTSMTYYRRAEAGPLTALRTERFEPGTTMP